MARVYEFAGVVPVVHPSAFVHPEAVLIGDVIVGAGCYVGPCASLRGDFGQIVVGAGANVQDSCTVHTFPGTCTTVGEDGHVGHGAVLHGCTVERGALVGINAVVLDRAVVGEYSLLAAGALVKADFAIPPRSLAAGSPAKVVRGLTSEEMNWKQNGTRGYQELARRCLASVRPAAPLAEVPENRVGVDWGDLVAVPLHQEKTRGG